MKLNLLICLIFLCSIIYSSEDEVPLVKVKEGLIRGIKDASVDDVEFYSYLGIPFAEPPVGKLRFKEPVPKSPWTGILETTKNPPLCLQKELMDLFNENISEFEPLGREDCLYLNVHTPQPGNSEANLPVMVFIHGGGFMSWGAELFGPKALVNEEIILVVIQYRLGIFGFFSTEDSILPGNMGLKDQQLALKWVKQNIKAFGGNPESITIFGESAGAVFVNMHIFSPGSKGLFQRAIIQSGSALCGWAISKNHKTFAVDVGNNLGCSLNEGTEKFLMCLQKADASKLLDLSLSTIEFGIAPFYGLPRVDGEFLPSHPATLLKKREYNKVDVIIGRTEHEGSFVLPSYVSDPSQLKKLQTNFERYGPMSLYLRENPDSSNMAEKIYKHYLKDGVNSLPDDIDDLEELLTDALFGYCQDLVVRFLADDPDTSLYLFRMDHLGEFSLLNGEPLASGKNWVTHTDELVYLFYGDSLFNFDLKKEEDLKFRKIITSLWRNFAKSGNPTPECSELKWDKIKGSNEIKQFSLTTNPKMEDYDFYEKRKLFTSLKTEQNILLGIYDDSYDQSSKTEL
ncbi:UNVERIFIED_CONTAM: hypothetical protein RMT77_007037 [Armadillidium vulgare]